jgi:hypothetical protein
MPGGANVLLRMFDAGKVMHGMGEIDESAEEFGAFLYGVWRSV